MNARRLGRRAFTLIEVLLALSLLAGLLVALNVFVFSMAEVWGAGRDERLFAQHARAVSIHVEEMLRSAALSPAGTGLAMEEVRDDRGSTQVELAFTLAEGSRLLEWPDKPLPDVALSLGLEERAGLRLHWRSRLEQVETLDAPRRLILSPFVTSLSWEYYDENFRRWETLEEPKRETDGTYPLPVRLKLGFTHGKLALTRIIDIPTAGEGATPL